MGFSGSWFAVQCDRERALLELDLAPAREIGEQLPKGLAVADLPDGWLLFFSFDFDQAFRPQMVGLSRHGPAVGCAIEEHVMIQEARGFTDGAEVWRVTHDPNRGESLYHLEVAGAPPAQLASIHAELKAEQDAEGGEDADVDLICDVPLNLARSICGFKHDEAWPEGFSFTELRKAGAAAAPERRPGFFARLFGRG